MSKHAVANCSDTTPTGARPGETPLRILVADDHAAVRAGVRTILEPAGFSVVAETSSAAETLEHAKRCRPDLYVVDLNLGESRGLDAVIRSLLELEPTARIVVYSYRSGIATINAAYEAGASAYVAKSADPEALITALNRVAAGHRHFLPGVGDRLAEYHTSGEKQTDPRKVLSRREMELLVRLARGESKQTTAAEMGIVDKTVNNVIITIRRKLGVNRAEFTRVALLYGLIEDEL